MNDDELKKMLKEVLDNQAVIYRKLDILQSKLLEGLTKSFYTVERAKEDMAKDRQNLYK